MRYLFFVITIMLSLVTSCTSSKMPLPKLEKETEEALIQYIEENYRTPEEYIISKFEDHSIVFAGEFLGRTSRSSLTRGMLFSFESMDAQGRTLNLGETVIMQDEINPFISALREQGILVTALHNHWLFDEPRLFYIHWESIDEPLAFARKTVRALGLLTDNNNG